VIYAIRWEAQHGLRRFISTIITQSTNLGTKQETFESIPRNLTGNKDSFQRPRLFPIEYRLPQLAIAPFRPRNAMKDKRLSTLDVAGSIPVSRSSSQELRALSIPADSVNFQLHKIASGGVLTQHTHRRPHRNGPHAGGQSPNLASKLLRDSLAGERRRFPVKYLVPAKETLQELVLRR